MMLYIHTAVLTFEARGTKILKYKNRWPPNDSIAHIGPL
jgi:hypothetical protein